MNLRPQAVRMVLAHGLPVVIEVTTDSMTPSLDRGTKIKVEPAAGEILPGEIVLILTDAGERHRPSSGDACVLGGRAAVRHPSRRRAHVHVRHLPARGGDRPRRRLRAGPSRPLPIPEPVQADARVRFYRRRRACAVFALGRRVASSLNVSENPVSRRLARVYRNVARKFAG